MTLEASGETIAAGVAGWLARSGDELVQLRRTLHEHPELARREERTTAAVTRRLTAAGLDPRPLPGGTGLWCDLGSGPGPRILVRADIDALPVPDAKDVAYRSTVPGVAHACGHDVHTVVGLGVALALAEVDAVSPLPGTVRVLFQPAEEVTPGGALEAIEARALAGVSAAFAVHCDPTLDVGEIGLKIGAITAANDHLRIGLSGPGGHTSRPQNTVDIVFALAKLAVELPAVLSRVVDPRAALSVVWGQIEAGSVLNAIPRTGLLAGTVRTRSVDAWRAAPELVSRVAEQLVAPYGARIDVDYRKGLPPTVNAAAAIRLLGQAADGIGEGVRSVLTTQSQGADDFALYLQEVPGALARLGTRVPGGVTHELHRGDFDVDERAIPVGVRLLAATVTAAMNEPW